MPQKNGNKKEKTHGIRQCFMPPPLVCGER